MTALRDLAELRDDLENAGSVPAWREPSTVIGRQTQALARGLRDRWVKAELAATTIRAVIAKHAAEVDAQRATNERLTAELDRLRALPVIATCGECGHACPRGSRTRPLCDHPAVYDVPDPMLLSIDHDGAPPDRCPLRGRR